MHLNAFHLFNCFLFRLVCVGVDILDYLWYVVVFFVFLVIYVCSGQVSSCLNVFKRVSRTLGAPAPFSRDT